jgi:hypothetical protein
LIRLDLPSQCDDSRLKERRNKPEESRQKKLD